MAKSLKKRILDQADEWGICATFRDVAALEHRKQGGHTNPDYIASKAKSDVYAECSAALRSLLQDFPICQCKEWELGIAKLNAPIDLQFARSGGKIQYDGKPFKFCPWCGGKSREA